MTLSSTTVKTSYSGDGSTKAFATGFIFWNSSELKVILVSSSGNETTWTEGTEYSVTGGSGSSGTVTASTTGTDYTPATGQTLVIKSNVLNVQETDLPAGGAFPSTSVEEELDRIVRRIQQGDERFERIPLLSEGSTFAGSSGILLPDPSENTVLAWSSSDNTKLKNLTPNTSAYLGTPITVAEGGTGSSTAAGARSSLSAMEQVLTTQGDIIRATSSGGPERVAVGADNTMLTSDGTTLGYETATSLFDSIFSSSQGAILFRSTQWTALSAGSSGQVLTSQGGGANLVWASAGTSKLKQETTASTGAVATGTTVLPVDDTIPQSTEGDEYLTASITPASSTNRLVIDGVLHMSGTAGTRLTVALFQDSTADALATFSKHIVGTSVIQTIPIHHEMAAGTTSSTTFKLRAGLDVAGTTTVNGQAGTRVFGGVCLTRLTIMEAST